MSNVPVGKNYKKNNYEKNYFKYTKCATGKRISKVVQVVKVTPYHTTKGGKAALVVKQQSRGSVLVTIYCLNS